VPKQRNEILPASAALPGRVVVVSNRVPDPATLDAQSGGLVVAVREHLTRIGGVWFGWSGGFSPGYGTPLQTGTRGAIEFKTLDLDPEDFAGYYSGYANGVLWPALHQMPGLQRFRSAELEAYYRVNRAFADRLAPALTPSDRIWVHDFQLLPLAGLLRAKGVANPIGFFLHVPFPAASIIVQTPRIKRLLEDLLAADLIGFQTEQDRDSFLDAAASIAGATRIGMHELRFRHRRVRVGVYPAEIETAGWRETAQRAARGDMAARLRRSLLDRHLVIGVDRLDPSKGLLEKVEAIRQLLARHEELQGQVTVLQVSPPSRKDVAVYRTLRRDLDQAVGALNSAYSLPDWSPMRLTARMVGRRTLAGYMRFARVGLVTPLRDGMNLVAKEFIAAQDPVDPGVLVLSQFAGAAQQLKAGALLVNPYDGEQVADALHQALLMGQDERRRRWERQWAVLASRSAADWGAEFLADLEAAGRSVPSAPGRLPDENPEPPLPPLPAGTPEPAAGTPSRRATGTRRPRVER
jgi:trehalose 6-phosphate synthase